jgi:hypothetical protein
LACRRADRRLCGEYRHRLSLSSLRSSCGGIPDP